MVNPNYSMHLQKPVLPSCVKDFEDVMIVALSTKTLDILDAVIMFSAILEGNGIEWPVNDVVIKIVWCSPLFPSRYKTYMLYYQPTPLSMRMVSWHRRRFVSDVKMCDSHMLFHNL